jgi:threonine synthase
VRLCTITHHSFTSFSHQDVVTVTDLKAEGMRVLTCDLWHGPTLAFKDLGLQVSLAIEHLTE